MDIKEIAEQVSKRIYVEDGLLLSKFISEKFAEAIIESYKAELLKEVGEPETIFDLTVFTSDQVAAAVAKATKPLEDQLAKAEHRVAEAICELLESQHTWLTKEAASALIRRKFVKEV